MQLQSRAGQQKRARRLPPRAQLRVKAQLQAHAHHLARFCQLAQAQGLSEAIRQVGIGSAGELERVRTLFNKASETDKTVKENNTQWAQEKKAALAREAAEREEKLREEEAAREKAEAEQARAEEIEWINQETKESILILAGMGQRPAARATIGYAQMLQDDYVRRLVEKTDDLLDYLWDKIHSGTWVFPETKEALDLDRLLAPVLQLEVAHSYFPTSTRQLTASLLRKWRGEDCDETDDDPRASFTQEVDRQPCSDPVSSTEEGDAKRQSSGSDSQCKR